MFLGGIEMKHLLKMCSLSIFQVQTKSKNFDVNLKKQYKGTSKTLSNIKD